MAKFIDTAFDFDDGASIKIIQVKRREDGPWVTYTINYPNSLPRKLVMAEKDFIDTFGHLFGMKNKHANDGI